MDADLQKELENTILFVCLLVFHAKQFSKDDSPAQGDYATPGGGGILTC